ERLRTIASQSVLATSTVQAKGTKTFPLLNALFSTAKRFVKRRVIMRPKTTLIAPPFGDRINIPILILLLVIVFSTAHHHHLARPLTKPRAMAAFSALTMSYIAHIHKTFRFHRTQLVRFINSQGRQHSIHIVKRRGTIVSVGKQYSTDSGKLIVDARFDSR
ncbi:unnamed protein product, partial [Sphacelaria rigidula]